MKHKPGNQKIILYGIFTAVLMWTDIGYSAGYVDFENGLFTVLAIIGIVLMYKDVNP